ncbi:MAG: class I SAM-dependent RNA methyltransferase [Nitrosomonas sp.]|nr:class I SAM-dependent RNA methyltransferase [Nitrosomonas sp.]
MNAHLLSFFAPCPRGLESVLSDELIKTGADAVRPANGGAYFQGNWQTCYLVNLNSRIASRVLWQVAKKSYATETDIYNIVLSLPWQEWFPPELTLRVNLAAIKCPLRSLDFITLKIKDAVCDKFRKTTGKRPSIDTVEPDIRIHGFLNSQDFTVYLDTSGDALFKRGNRKSAGEAPLRENLAAGILYLTGWQPHTPLLDPMCGSGTFLLEAAQIALNIAPGSQRRFAFEQFNHFDQQLWQTLKNKAHAEQRPLVTLPIYGSDLYGYALANARTNLEAAGLLDAVHLKQANILEISAPEPHGTLVINPPYGVRIGKTESLNTFYPEIGNILKNKFSGWNAYILSADPALPKTIRLKASRRTPLFNGALECRLFEYKLVSGSMRTMDKVKIQDH